MERLGFRMVGNRAGPPDTSWYVQFCAPPLSVGHQPVHPIERRTAAGTLELLSPTDCVLDRLMKYFHWGDEQALDQAVLVATAQHVDLTRIKDVTAAEGGGDLYRIFEQRLTSSSSQKRES
jgi:hypothetical protein